MAACRLPMWPNPTTANLTLSTPILIQFFDFTFYITIQTARFGTSGRSVGLKTQMVTTFAHPTGMPGRITHHQGIGGHTAGDDRPCSYKGVVANFNAANNGGVGPDGGTLADFGRPVLMFAGNGAAGIEHIGKNSRGPHKTIVLTYHALVGRNVVLHFYVVAQYHAGGHHNVLTETAIASDATAGYQVAKVPDARTGANFTIFIDYGRLVDECFFVYHKLGFKAHSSAQRRTIRAMYAASPGSISVCMGRDSTSRLAASACGNATGPANAAKAGC